MKKHLLGVFTAVLLLTSLGLGQTLSNQGNGQYFASVYGKYSITATAAVAGAGAATVTVAPCFVESAGNNAKSFTPLFVNNSLRVNDGASSESVTVTAVSLNINAWGSGSNCSFTATFGSAHASGVNITSGTFGLDEAIKDATKTGGIVVLDPSYSGGASVIAAAANGSTAVTLKDIRSGTESYWGYNGSTYALVHSVTAAGLSLPVGTTTLSIPGPNGSSCTYGTTTELLTVAAAATSTTASATILPANSFIDGVVGLVTVAIPTATTFTVGDGTTAARFATGIAVAQGTGFWSPAHMNPANTNAAGPVQASAAAIVVTPNGTPGTNVGRIRLVVFYHTCIAPTS